MTKHFCDRCRQEAKEYDLTEIGARASSKDNTALFRAQDIELCKACWEELEEFLKPLPVPLPRNE